MRDYGKVSAQFWIGKTGKALRGNPEAQVLALYMMTSPHSTMTGVFHCPVLYMAHETGLGMEGASKALHSLIEAGFCEYDEASECVFVVRMAAHQIDERLKPKDLRIVGVRKEVERMPLPLKTRFLEVYGAAFLLVETDSPPEAPSEPLPSQEQEQEQEQEQKKSIGRSADVVAPAGFTRFWSAWPASPRKVGKGKCLAIWKRKGLEDMADWLVAHVATMKASEQWRKGYDPRPESYLNGEQWPDPADRDVGGDPAQRFYAVPREFRGAI